jgi:hypothetical protein
MNHIIIFLLNMATDYLAVMFTRAIIHQNRLQASIVSAAIVALGLCSVWFVVEDITCIVPAVLGAGIGTYFTVGKKKR